VKTAADRWVPEVAGDARELYEKLAPDPDRAALVKRLGTARSLTKVWRKIPAEKRSTLFARACFLNTKTLTREEVEGGLAEHREFVEKLRSFVASSTEEDKAVLLRAAENLERKVAAVVGYTGPWVVDKHKVDARVRGYALALSDTFEELLGGSKSWDAEVAAITTSATERKVARRTVYEWRTYVGKQNGKN
jgi:hypothetical protein